MRTKHADSWKRRLRDWFIMPHSQRPLRGEITEAELLKHQGPHDCWVAIGGNVYDVTNFLQHHPGGPKYILDCAGIDATRAFEKHHVGFTADDALRSNKIGQLVAGDGPSLVVTSMEPLSVAPGDATGAVPPKVPTADEMDDFAAVWENVVDRDGAGRVHKEKVARFLHDMDHAVSDDEVLKILARVEGDYVTFEEFCTML